MYREYARGTPVSVKIVVTERIGDFDEADDSVGVIICGTRFYVVVVTHRFTMTMDMHDVNNETMAMLMAWDIVHRVR